MADTTRFALGDWNFYCDLCGKKAKASTAMKTWDGFYVCQSHKEVRNQQDFVRGIKDDQSVPWTRPGGSGSSSPTPPAPPTGSGILLEGGGYLLQENNDNILLEA